MSIGNSKPCFSCFFLLWFYFEFQLYFNKKSFTSVMWKSNRSGATRLVFFQKHHALVVRASQGLRVIYHLPYSSSHELEYFQSSITFNVKLFTRSLRVPPLSFITCLSFYIPSFDFFSHYTRTQSKSHTFIRYLFFLNKQFKKPECFIHPTSFLWK